MHEAGAEFFESYDIDGETFYVGDDGELHARIVACMQGAVTMLGCKAHAHEPKPSLPRSGCSQ